jgi:glycosyltransferase involved in cell wall biosynthesis
LVDQPLVSVIIPVFNTDKYLDAALKSVFSQTYSNMEVIVIDDGSTDDSATIAKSYTAVRYFHQKNKGVSAARNIGLEESNGEYIAFLDADDLWKPKKTEEQVHFMMQHQNVGLTGTYAENFLEEGTQLPGWLKNDPNWSKHEDYIIPSTMMARRSVFERVGVFDTNLPSGEDTDLLWRVREFGIELDILEKILVRRRFHGENLSWKYKAENNKRLLQIARQSIQRKSGRV